jgi:hypothetical protein
MLSLVLAVVVTIPPAATVDEACDPAHLAPFLAAPRSDQIKNEMELDRRIAATLAEERAVEKQVAEAGTRAADAEQATGRVRWALVGLALLGLVLGIVAARRPAASMPLSLAAWVLVAGAALAGWRMADQVTHLRAEHQAVTARQLALSTCRHRVAETRSLLMHTRVANCTHDLSEVDEDIWGWVTKMNNPEGYAVTKADLEKMHKEINDALRY